MSYIRIRKHYLHTPYLVLGVLEFGVLFATLFLLQYGQKWLLDSSASFSVTPLQALVFALILSLGTLAMGVYLAMVREGFASMFFRTLVAFCFLGGLGLSVLYLILPTFDPGSSNLFWAVALATGLVTITRQGFVQMVDSDQLARRVVIYGSGAVARELIDDYERNMKALGIRIVGCIKDDDNPEVDEKYLLPSPKSWTEFFKSNNIAEVIIAPQERRRNRGGQFPLEELMACKLQGVVITDALSFYERELKKARLDLVQPSWILYSDGFKASKSRDISKRLFDILISLTLLLVLFPVLVLTALAVVLESGLPVLYSQTRVGMNGKPFRIFKFRSMRQDAEKEGKAVWASQNDSRITRVGAFIRNTRLDELPQLYNVIRGDMSFVGPRPERPEFVSELNEKIPYYDTRHYVKPGLMGWAQLNYPYGASVEDARGKLEYDLYYSKNHSFIMDLLIMIQTVEVVLLGKGVR